MKIEYRLKVNEEEVQQISAQFTRVDGENETDFYDFNDQTHFKIRSNCRFDKSWNIISKDQFVHLFEIWKYEKYSQTKEQKQQEEVEYVAKTRYTIFSQDIILEGYSRRDRNELCNFLLGQGKKGFIMLDQDGCTLAIIGAAVAAIASYTFETLK